jgi:hypothetical protein
MCVCELKLMRGLRQQDLWTDVSYANSFATSVAAVPLQRAEANRRVGVARYTLHLMSESRYYFAVTF